MNVKDFVKTYDLNLIPASNEGIVLGTCVWDSIIAKPKFSHPGMPDVIFMAFEEAKLITKPQMLDYIEKSKAIPMGDASLAGISVDVEVHHAASLEYPTIGKISNSFDLTKAANFSFGELKAKIMTPLLRVEIDEYIENLKVKKWKDYDGKIRRVFMITELYYGSLKILINKTVKQEFEGALETINLSVSSKSELSKTIEYSFDETTLPFAMKIEKVSSFNR